MFRWTDLADTQDVRSGILTVPAKAGASPLELHIVKLESGLVAFWTTKHQAFTIEATVGSA